jgi:NIMA (never in mitosis gene a)-related kinase
VKYLHDKHILHRDLKVLNVFINEEGLCKLGDFGVSKQLESSEMLTSTHVGTAYYLPPEICNNNSYDHKVDIWMLGCLLYELCALSKPFEGDNLFVTSINTLLFKNILNWLPQFKYFTSL